MLVGAPRNVDFGNGECNEGLTDWPRTAGTIGLHQTSQK